MTNGTDRHPRLIRDPKDDRKLPFSEARARLMAEIPLGDADNLLQIQHFATIGAFIVERWLMQMEVSGGTWRDLDDAATRHLLDDCSEGRFRDLQVSFKSLVEDTIRKHRANAFVAENLGAKKLPVGLRRFLSWSIAEGWKAAWAAVFLLIAGTLIGVLARPVIRFVLKLNQDTFSVDAADNVAEQNRSTGH